MHFLRTFQAALIALSVVMVPASGEATVSTKPVEMSMPTMPDHAAMPCCPPDDRKGSIACAFKCISFVGVVLPAVVVLLVVDDARASFVKDAIHTHVSSPPTRPPPV
jgi:hypothetical protein